MRWLTLLITCLFLSLISASAQTPMLLTGAGQGPHPNKIITSVALTPCGASCTFISGTAGTIATALATVSSGNPNVTWSLKTSGIDNLGTTCNSYGTDFALNASTGALTNSLAAPAQGYSGVCITATGNYVNSPFTQAFTIVGNPSGGPGLVLVFDDEFTGSQLEHTETASITSMGYSSVTGGAHMPVVLSNMSPISGVGMSVSISGATVSGGTCPNTAVNGTFSVDTWSNPTAFTLWNPQSCSITSINVSGATIGFGPWVGAIQKYCSSSPCNGSLFYAHNGIEGFDVRQFTEASASGLTLTSTNSAFTDPLNNSYSYTGGQIQTWNGSSGFAQVWSSTGTIIDWNLQPANAPTNWSGWSTYGNGNIWNATTGSGQLNVVEFGLGSQGANFCTSQRYDVSTHAADTGIVNVPGSGTQNFPAALHQYTADLEPGGGITFYLDGVSVATFSSGNGDNFVPSVPTSAPQYLVMNNEIDFNIGCGSTPTLPNTIVTRYVRVYQKVASNACYAADPFPAAAATVARGPCPSSGQTPVAINGPASVNLADNSASGATVATLSVSTSNSLAYTGWLNFDDTGVCADSGVGGACTQPFGGAYPDGNTATVPGTARFILSGGNVVTGRALTSADDGVYNLHLVAAENGVVQTLTIPVTVSSSSGTLAYSLPTGDVIHFMAANGNDSCNGTSSAIGSSGNCAWLTPNHALNCGDVVVSAAGAYGTPTGQIWGVISNCPSTTGGIDGTGGIYGAILLCGSASVGDCSLNDSTHYAAMDMNRNNWVVEGWQVTSAVTSGSQPYCFLADGRLGGPNAPIVHHLIYINTISYNCASGYTTSDGGTNHGVSPGNGVDQWAVIGSIAYNSATLTGGLYDSAIDDPGPASFDSSSGTHVAVIGNYLINNQQPFGGNTDGESIMFDTWDAHGYHGQGIIQDNIMYISERNGIHIFDQNSISPYTNPSVMRVFNNTVYDVSNGNNTANSFALGNIDTAIAGTPTTWPWPTAIFNNISLTQSATSANGTALYALQLGELSSATNMTVGGTGIENILKGLETSCAGGATCDSGFNVRTDDGSGVIGTNIYENPTFKNTTDLLANHIGQPNCSGFETTTACMGWNYGTQTATSLSVIDDLTATSTHSPGKGYQPPGACVTSGERFNDYPVWLKGINYLHWNGSTLTEKSGLTTKPCNM